MGKVIKPTGWEEIHAKLVSVIQNMKRKQWSNYVEIGMIILLIILD